MPEWLWWLICWSQIVPFAWRVLWERLRPAVEQTEAMLKERRGHDVPILLP
jgi:hypothetical protein